MLKIGIVGLGSIAQKAYLPYMRQLAEVEWHLFTRNQEVLHQTAHLFSHVKTYASLEELADATLDGIFIHTATVSHREIVALFLSRGIPVYVDKPVTQNYEETKELYDLASIHQTFLMVGFNRRFAPRVAALKEETNKTKIYVEKNDVNRPGDLVFKVFDFFIHPLDTAIFLMDNPPKRAWFHYHKNNGLLSQVTVTLVSKTETVIVGMNLQSGSRREIVDVQLPEKTLHVEELSDLTIYEDSTQTKQNYSAWDRTLYKRGFESIVLAFIEAVKTGVNPVSETSSLLSHYLCQQIVDAQSDMGELSVLLPK
ncbi:Gfo/Idh/MocA family protein [Streptococcus pacificus]|uniref:Gfo/Idh/MocA family oxidoreductase n=1 Tax=Streptococcus pacificus TaxID=2740577 RepID=A0ABS0ZL57_9STRE|nr:Gfo/Idh/MocA family oxidoreductase [Streptococcus pacificus]MBJ8326281.1 Gfo/Idh/MocA family oxidoreductase [Streptococcus pacificus]